MKRNFIAESKIQSLLATSGLAGGSNGVILFNKWNGISLQKVKYKAH